MSNPYTISVEQAYEILTDSDVMIFYDDSQVDEIILSDQGVYALLVLADGRGEEVLIASTVYATRKSAWSADEDQEQ